MFTHHIYDHDLQPLLVFIIIYSYKTIHSPSRFVKSVRRGHGSFVGVLHHHMTGNMSTPFYLVIP